MTRHIERLLAMKREMIYDHWLPRYTWIDFDVEDATRRYNTTVSKVREAMKQIGRIYPKPKGLSS